MYIRFSGMPCLEGENNGFSYLLPQVDYSPHAFYIPVALTSKVLTVNKQNSARHGFTRGDAAAGPWPHPQLGALQAALHLPPLQPSGSASTASPHPSRAADPGPGCGSKMMCLWLNFQQCCESLNCGVVCSLCCVSSNTTCVCLRELQVQASFSLLAPFTFVRNGTCQKLEYCAAIHKSCSRQSFDLKIVLKIYLEKVQNSYCITQNFPACSLLRVHLPSRRAFPLVLGTFHFHFELLNYKLLVFDVALIGLLFSIGRSERTLKIQSFIQPFLLLSLSGKLLLSVGVQKEFRVLRNSQ